MKTTKTTNKLNRKLKRSEAGFALMLILMILGILGIIALLSFGYGSDGNWPGGSDLPDCLHSFCQDLAGPLLTT